MKHTLRMRLASRIIVVLLAVPVSPGLHAVENWSINGAVGGEIRLFPESPQYPGQMSGAQSALLLNPELRYRSQDGRNLVRIAPNIRIDNRDSDRSLVDITELAWIRVGRDWETTIGISKVFWGVAESRHLIDIINQTDAAEDLDGEEKLGQPMFNLASQREWGRVSAFILAGFRERTFPGGEGRVRTPLPVDTDNPEYESGTEQKHVDVALRYSHYLGDWDFGAAVFRGTGREPRLRVNDTGTALIPIYDQITQFGADLQYTREAWLWKFEGIVRTGQGDTFAASVAGLEYTLYQLRETSLDLGLLVEYLYDGRDDDAPVTIYDNDVFFGARLALNDTQDTSLLMGGIVDIEDQSTVFSLEAERRIGNGWKLELESRWFINASRDSVLQPVEKDDHITVRVRRYF